VENYLRYYRRPGDVLPAEAEAQTHRTDVDVLRDNWRFIRRAEDDTNATWEQRLSKRYYDRLYKEYALADLRQYKTGQVRRGVRGACGGGAA
jgi:protein FRA10AC1